MTATASSMACDQPYCGGSVVDGYCDTCGLAPVDAPRGARGSGRASARIDVDRLTASSRRSGPSSGASHMGAGVVEIAPLQEVDPATVIMADPSVPESRRFCTRCDHAVGRGDGGRPGRQAGFCSNCGARFDFAPKLRPGDLVAGQYEVAGALAHGGLGWIYLVRDRNVSDRWCVLKGLLDAADPAAAEAAVAERRFLAEVRHPAIVDIYNFVQHAGQGYIVMEYVGGPSLKQVAMRRRQAGEGPMPVAEAAAYLLAVLPAFGYLHERGLVYCDFKPDNVIHVGDTVELIDLGGVRGIDDAESAIFGTPGYQAPEVPKTGPTVASDLYTIGRSLAVLILDWPGWQGADRERLPPREDHQVLVDHDCLWRFLQRACAADPAERFADAVEMAEALHGVLCQVAAAGDGRPRPYTSTRWTPPRPRVDGLDWWALPVPLLPSHPRAANRVAGLADGDPAAAIGLAAADDGELSWADHAAVARAHCELGDTVAARAAIDALDVSAAKTPGTAAVVHVAATYLRGIAALAAGDATVAATWFDAAYAAAPGEPACALALATALEAVGDPARREEAATLYEQVAVTDPTWVSAVAGLARVLLTLGRVADAARVLTAVPAGHPSRAEALTLACRAMERDHYVEEVASAASERLRAAAGKRTAAEAELAAALYRAALASVLRGEPVGATVGGRSVSASQLARATEAALLDLAEATPDAAHRHELLDTAARTRPWSLW